jgi:hypothetical protein
MRHRAFRIEPRRFLERTDGRAVTESKDEVETLVEILPRFRRLGRNRS